MNRLRVALIAVAVVAAVGCRHSSCGHASNSGAAKGCSTAMPVSYPVTSMPMNSYPASYNGPVTGYAGLPTAPMMPTTGLDGATELPFPGPAIPPTTLPTSPVSVNPGAARSASLPK